MRIPTTFLYFLSVAGMASLGNSFLLRSPPQQRQRSTRLSASPENWMTSSRQDPKLIRVVQAFFDSCKEISYKIRTASCDKMSCYNEFGDEQLAIDLLADEIIFQNLAASGQVATASSEETSDLRFLGGSDYSVAFDPLDGSSIIDTNFAVGTIFGVWAGKKLTGVYGRDLVAAGIAIYGPRTTITIAVEGIEGAHEFLLMDDFTAKHGQWTRTKSFYNVQEGKMFSPGNIRALYDVPGYKDLYHYWITHQYQMRYTGGMVPDVNQILVKGKGIFVYPGSPLKLRLLYEVAPLAFLMEKAGGASSDGEGSLLDRRIVKTEDRCQVALGSRGEVERFEKMMGGIVYET